LIRLDRQGWAGRRSGGTTPVEKLINNLHICAEGGLYILGETLQLRKQRLEKRPVRKSQVLVTTTLTNPHAVTQGGCSYLFEEPSLTDTGIALEEYNPRMAGERCLQAALELVHFPPTANKKGDRLFEAGQALTLITLRQLIHRKFTVLITNTSVED
jgi:hypothetical protein